MPSPEGDVDLWEELLCDEAFQEGAQRARAALISGQLRARLVRARIRCFQRLPPSIHKLRQPLPLLIP